MIMQENRKFVIIEIGLFTVTILFWAIWFLKAFAWVEYKDRQAAVLGTVLIALAVVMLVAVYALFRLARPSYMLVKRRKKMVIVIISTLLVVVVNFFMLYRYRDYGYTISTIALITEKESEGGNFYFQIADSNNEEVITFSCDEQMYKKLKVDNSIDYYIQYRRLSFGERKAIVGYVDRVNPIDKENKNEQDS